MLMNPHRGLMTSFILEASKITVDEHTKLFDKSCGSFATKLLIVGLEKGNVVDETGVRRRKCVHAKMSTDVARSDVRNVHDGALVSFFLVIVILPPSADEDVVYRDITVNNVSLRVEVIKC